MSSSQNQVYRIRNCFIARNEAYTMGDQQHEQTNTFQNNQHRKKHDLTLNRKYETMHSILCTHSIIYRS